MGRPVVALSPLAEFLARQRLVSTSTARWRRGIELRINGYLSDEAPPAELVSSARAIVLREDSLLVMSNLDGDHILPGGRLEEGETPEEALRRELLKEAGVEVVIMGRIGFMHLRHTSPKPDGYPYLYPDFIWPIWAVSFVEFKPDLMIDDGYEVSSRFVPLQGVDEFKLDVHEPAFVTAALALRKTLREL
jgi:ADP-ribose pyrophosphatase YjhB (NUDIX family)